MTPKQQKRDAQANTAVKRRQPTHQRAKAASKPAGSGQPPTKTRACLDLLTRTGGASLAELRSITGWQPHSVRGFLAGTVKKKLGLTLTSEKTGDGERRYRVDRALALAS